MNYRALKVEDCRCSKKRFLVPLHGSVSVDTSDPNTANKIKVTQKTNPILLWFLFNSYTCNQTII